jgi:hypothetical protein
MCGIALSLSGAHIQGHLGKASPAGQEEVPPTYTLNLYTFQFHINFVDVNKIGFAL